MTDKTHKATKNDLGHSIVKGVLGAVPVIGSLASEIFGLIVTPPLEKRRAEWMNEVAEKLKKLEENGKIDFNELKDNDQFIDVVLQATTFALKTSEKRKIEYFRNAILNTAIGETPDKTKSQIFLNQLDKFTTLHVLILDFIDSPNDWFKKSGETPPSSMMGSLHSVLIEAFPELKGQDELLEIIWSDLESTGFHKSGSLKTMMTGSGLLSDRTTQIGKEFISFITAEND